MTQSRSSTTKVRQGNQRPRILVCPRSQFTDGKFAGLLASEYGLTPDPWQQLVLDSWLACRKDHMYVSDTCCLSVPRQNGKNSVLEMVELFKMTVQHRRILHTAHEVKTARKSFLRLKSFFEQEEQYPELASMVKFIRMTNGQECIQLQRRNEYGDVVDGGSIEFIARSKSSGRGFTVDDVVCDEAQEMTDEQFEVLRSTNSAAPSGNPQFFMTGTPTPPSSPGTVFGRTRKTAVSGNGKRLCWVEWSVDSVGDVRDMDRVFDTNPALGFRLQLSVIDGELNSMEPEGFARERLGWWVSGSANRVIDQAEWNALAVGYDEVPLDEAPNRKAYGVKFSPDGSSVAVCVAVMTPDGNVHVEIVDDGIRSVGSGVRWLSNWLYERKDRTAAVAIDGMSNMNTLVEQLAELRYPPKAVMLPGTGGIVAASTMLVDAVRERRLTHFGQEQLNESVTNAERRQIGNRGGWGFGGSGSAPAEAASLALWAVKTSRRVPGRKAVVF